MQNFQNLRVWRSAHEIAVNVYELTASFPRQEQFGLVSQIRRAATSIPANIAEGCGRGSDADFARLLQIAAGSASELEYHLLLSRDLKILVERDYQTLIARLGETRKMLSALIQKLQSGHRQQVMTAKKMLSANS